MTIALSQTLAPVKDNYVRLSANFPRSASFTTPPATGELIVVRGYGRFYTPNQAAETLSVTDNKGNTYSVFKQTELDDDPDDEFFAWVAWCVHSGSGSGTHTISWYLNTGTDTDYHYRGYWAAHSYSSNGWANPLDKSIGNNSSSNHTSLAITTGALAQASELLVAVWGGYQYNDLDQNVVPPSGWTNRHLTEGETLNIDSEASSMDDLIVSATTTQTVTYSHDTQSYAAMVVMSFKESASSGNTVTFTTSPIEVAVGAAVNVTTRVMNGGSPVSGVSVTCTSNLPEIAQVLDDTPSSGSVVLTCTPGATQLTSPYQSDNNVWGSGNVGTNPWSQCTGLSTMQSGSKVNFRTVWAWPNVGDDSVKAYPEIIYGQKPGHTEVGSTALPLRLSEVTTCTAAWDGLTETLVGARGQFTFDLWLQADATSYTSFYAAPKTHEIMLPISAYGTPQYGVPPNRNPAWLRASNVTVDSRAFNIYDTGSRNFGDSNNPWRFVVYQPLSLSGGAITSATIDWAKIFYDMVDRGIAVGNEYLVALEVGVEPIYGNGDSLLTGYKVVDAAASNFTKIGIRSDMSALGQHDYLMHSIPPDWGWGTHSRIGVGANPPTVTGWENPAWVPWVHIATAANSPPGTHNWRVAVRAIYHHERRNGTWQTSGTQVTDTVNQMYGDEYVDYPKNTIVTGDERTSNGYLEVKLGNGGGVWHGFPTFRTAMTAGVQHRAVLVKCQLTLDNGGGTDDRAGAQVVMVAGGDYWKSMTAVWEQGQYNVDDFAIGRGKRIAIAPAYSWHTAHTMTSEADVAGYLSYVQGLGIL